MIIATSDGGFKFENLNFLIVISGSKNTKQEIFLRSFFFFFFFFFGGGLSVGPILFFFFFFFFLFYLLKLIYKFILPLHFLSMIQKETLCFIKTFPSNTDYLFCALAMYV